MYPQDTINRFWNKVNKTESCWLWTGYCMPFGHGQINIGNHKIKLTHRLSWEIHYGPIPEGLQVCHHCDIPNCIRPDHLFLGTQRDNVQDAAKKNRMSRKGSGDAAPHSEQHWSTHMTTEKVRLLIQMRNDGVKYSDIAEFFGIHFSTARDIYIGRRWKHFPR